MSRIAIIGDLIIDHTVRVEPSKIAPEAPIIAYRILSEHESFGGAGAVLDAVRALEHEAEMPLMVVRPFVQITRKTRMVCAGSRNPSIVGRYDADSHFAWDDEIKQKMLQRLASFRPDVVVISDYGKGVVCRGLTGEIKTAVGSAPVLVDPYTADWSLYEGGDVIVPSRLASAHFLSDQDMRGFKAVVAKLDAAGCRLYGDGPVAEFAAVARAVVDVTGAGDQFIATLAAWLAEHPLQLTQAVRTANIAAGMQVERSGIVPVTRADLLARLKESA